MKKNKGFTLVELLAVISILAIIVIIAIPNIIKIFNNSKENLRVQTVRTYIKEAEKFYLNAKLSNSDLIDGETNVIDKITIDGKPVDDGIITVTNKGEIKVALEIEGRCYKNKDDEIVVEENYVFCDIVDNRIVDETPGTLSGTGSVSSPFKIESIEDFVEFSNIINTGTFPSKYSVTYYKGNKINSGYMYVLENDLDFKSKYSYVNYKNKDFGDINGDGRVDTIMEELNTGSGLPIISKTARESFYFYFNGQGKTLKNLTYNIKNEDASKTIYVSLFGFFDGSFSATNIVNFNIENININVDTAGSARIAPIMQQISSYYDNQIMDINISGNINAKCGGTCIVGGAAVDVFTYGSPHSVKNINSKVNINVEANSATVSGLLPIGSNYGYYSIDNTYTGNINVKSTTSAYVGGIYGQDRPFFYAVNTAVNGNINVEAKEGIVHGIGRGSAYNSYYKGDIKVTSAIPLDTTMIGDGTIQNSYAIGNIIIDATRRYDWPRIGGLNSQGKVDNSYYIGDIYYKTVTSYGGGGPTVYCSLLTGEGNVSNSFVRGKITNEQQTTWSTYFGYLTTHESGDTEPTVTNSYYTNDTTYTGNAPLYKGGTQISSSLLKTSSWYKDTLNIGEHWKLTDGYYPQLYKCNFDNSTKTCNPTQELVPNQQLITVE